MFNQLPNLKTFSEDKLTIDQLVTMIRNHPFKDKIEKIRSITYKCNEYQNIKVTLPCITPHGYFSSLKKDGLSEISGYLYYDIDGFETDSELQSNIVKLNTEYKITMICTSCGGKGLSMLLRVANLTIVNFENTYKYVASLLIDRGFNIDKAASGLSRKMIVSYDSNIIYNKDNYFKIDNNLIIKYLEELNDSKSTVSKKRIQYTLNGTFSSKEIIPMKELLKTIRVETTYDKAIDGDYVIDPQDSYKIMIPKQIKDGDKHKVYRRIVYALHYLNPTISSHEAFSFLCHVNNSASPRMDKTKLVILVTNLCVAIAKQGIVSLKTRTKKIHFNPDLMLTTKDKQSLSAKINGALITNITIEQINDTKAVLVSKNLKPTQKAVSEATGLSLRTVKRNWRKEATVIADLVLVSDVDTKKSKLPESSKCEWDYDEDYSLTNDDEDNNDHQSLDDFFAAGFCDDDI